MLYARPTHILPLIWQLLALLITILTQPLTECKGCNVVWTALRDVLQLE